MHGFYIERRKLSPGTTLSRDLAQHIFTRGAKGRVVIVTDRPHDLLSTTKKQWQALIRVVERERSSTLKLFRIAELSNQIIWMKRLRFTSKFEKDEQENCVIFTPVDSLVLRSHVCSTLYIIQKLSDSEVSLITSELSGSGVVVIYER